MIVHKVVVGSNSINILSPVMNAVHDHNNNIYGGPEGTHKT